MARSTRLVILMDRRTGGHG